MGGKETDDWKTDPDSQWCWSNYVSFRAMQQADNVRNQLKRSMEKLDLFVFSLSSRNSQFANSFFSGGKTET